MDAGQIGTVALAPGFACMWRTLRALTFGYTTHSIFSSTCGVVLLYVMPHYTRTGGSNAN
jgi:hypothetical protein